MFDKPFQREEERARQVLEDVVKEQGGGPKRSR